MPPKFFVIHHHSSSIPRRRGREEKRCRLWTRRGRGRRDAERQGGFPTSCSSSAGFLAASLPKRRRRQLQRESRGMSVGSAAAAAASQWEALEHTEEGARPLSLSRGEPLPASLPPSSPLRRRRRGGGWGARQRHSHGEREREVQKRVWKLQSRPLGLSPWKPREAVAVAVAMGKPLREGGPPPPPDSSPPVERGLRWADPEHTFLRGGDDSSTGGRRRRRRGTPTCWCARCARL